MTELNLHALERRSRANGPGTRFVLWFQGCSLACPGCFNPKTHETDVGEIRPIDKLVEEILAEGAAIEGITLSGGEPLEQARATLELVRAVRAESDLSILVFSGYAIEEIQTLAHGAEVLARIDVLIDGRYLAPQRLGRHLRGSRNQRVHLLSKRYTRADVDATPDAEIRIDHQGRITLTGVDPPRIK